MEQTNEAAVQGPGGARLQKSVGKKPLIIGGVVLGVLLAAYLGLCGYARSLDTFYPNTSLNGVDMAGLTVSQAAERLRQEIPGKTLAFYLPKTDETGDGSSAPLGEMLYEETPAATVTYGELGLTDGLDYAADAEFAFRMGQRQGNVLSAGWRYLEHAFHWSGPMGGMQTPDAAIFQDKISALAKQFSREPQDASYEMGDGEILITRELGGLRVSSIQLAEPVLTAISQSWNESLLVDATILPGKTLTAQALYDTVSGEVKNAGYDAATDTILPEQVGAEFDVATAQAALDAAAPGETVSVPAKIEYPRVTAQDLKGVLFRDVLGSATTHVGGSAARISNVKLASAAFNCGDVFSYNQTVGQRTEAKGYQPAPAYVKGETVDEIGGGVCQPSSTLYLACLRSNLEITERYAHRYAPSYIEWGMDATVSWGGPNYRFTNNTDYPIKVITTYAKGYLTVKLLGTKTDNVAVKMTHEVLATTPSEVVYEDDPTLAPGTQTVKVTPYTGQKVRSYRNLYADGKLLSSTFEASSNYKSRNKVILRGPALPVTEPAAPAIGPAPGEETSTLPETPPEEITPEVTPNPEVTPPVQEPAGTPVIVIPTEE